MFFRHAQEIERSNECALQRISSSGSILEHVPGELTLEILVVYGVLRIVLCI